MGIMQKYVNHENASNLREPVYTPDISHSLPSSTFGVDVMDGMMEKLVLWLWKWFPTDKHSILSDPRRLYEIPIQCQVW